MPTKRSLAIPLLYLLEEEVLLEQGDIKKAQRTKYIPQVHMVKRLFNIQKVPYMELI